MSKREFIETCVSLSLLDKKDILKLILSEKVKTLCETLCETNHVQDDDHEVPSDISILDFSPNTQTFSDYAFALFSLSSEKEEIMKYIIGREFDKIMDESAPGTPVSVTSSPPPMKRRRRITILPPLSLPNNLALFTYKKDDTVFTLTSMPEIIDRFFKGLSVIFQGIYADSSKKNYLLLVIDNGRYKNVWKSSGKANKLTWCTSHEDIDKREMKNIINSDRIDIVRKRNGEYRYMGKSTKIDNIDYEEGSCEFLVS